MESLSITVPQKNNATPCEDYRTISLKPHLQENIQKSGRKHKQNRGFRSARVDLNIIAQEIKQEIYICFVDYESAFNKLLENLRITGNYPKDFKIIESRSTHQNRWPIVGRCKYLRRSRAGLHFDTAFVQYIFKGNIRGFRGHFVEF